MEIFQQTSPLRRLSKTGPLQSAKSLIPSQRRLTLSQPCSLSDFMDYLFYVERNAEPLQFFLWYWDYIQRWSNLLPRQKALSPPWDPEKAMEPPSRFIKYSHKREQSLKMNKILTIMEMGSQRASLDDSSSLEDDGQIASIITSPLASPAAILSPTGSVKPPDWQPCTFFFFFSFSLDLSLLPRQRRRLAKIRDSHNPATPGRSMPHHPALHLPHGATQAPPVSQRPRGLPARGTAHHP